MRTANQSKASQTISCYRRLSAVCLFLLISILPALAQTREEKLALANKTLDEGTALFQKGTAESFRSVREKFLTSAKLFKEAGEQGGEAVSLVGAGRISDNLGEKALALNYYDQALPIWGQPQILE